MQNPIIPKPDAKTTDTILAVIFGPESGMQDALASMQNPIGLVKSTLIDLVEQIKLAWAYVITLKGEKDAYVADIAVLDGQKTALSSEVIGLQGMLDNKKEVMEKEFTAFMATKNNEIKEAEALLVSTKAEADATESKKISTLGVIADLETRQSEIVSDIKVKQADLARFQNELASVEGRFSSTTENHKALVVQVSKLESSRDAHIQAIEDAKAKIEDHKAIKTSLERDTDVLSAKLSDLNDGVGELNKRAFIVGQRESVINQRKLYVEKLYQKAGVPYPKDPTDTGPDQK